MLRRIFIFMLGLLLLFGPVFVSYDPRTTNTSAILQAPDAQHPMGTDHLGRDVLSRTLHGGQQSISVAVLAFMVAIVPGFILGIFAGWSRSVMDASLLAVLNGLLGLPSMLMALALITIMGQGLIQIGIATGISQIAAYALVTRVIVRRALQEQHVDASRALGASEWHLLRWHVLPGIRVQAMVYANVVFAYVLLNSAALSFLGLGGDPSIPDWGVMLSDGRQSFRQAPWVALPPGLAISLTIWLSYVPQGHRSPDGNLRAL